MYNLKNKKKWYVIQVFSSFENKVVNKLKYYIKLNKLENEFGDILIPIEKVVEMKNGIKIKSDRKFFPGYFLINMIMNEKNWYLIKSIPRIIGFIGGNSKNPFPINENEINIIKNKLSKIDGKFKPKILFELGELIRVNNGPFSDFSGTVEEVDYIRNRLKVSVLIFGRSTPVELDFSQVEKNY